ncbi:4-hydroxythreonine-4-phosphate dehydrogenase PdxA [Alteribacillus sp. HJP-4]|uniref:4-hydroxythreonine-4-phosphate dehydrogenase PdxA n=1 Tax=Alteribacillus sp. HJP-4 TaxID=2775394 RepID=UPI0035CCD4BF
MNQQKLKMGLTLGDATGIGPEIAVKALQNQKIRSKATWVIVGDERILKQGMTLANVSLDYLKASTPAEADPEKSDIWLVDIENLSPEDYELGIISENSGKITGNTLKKILSFAQDSMLDGVVYAPLNKEALHRGGHHFADEIHFFADVLMAEEGFGEVNVMEDLWLTRLTSHIPLKEVSKQITYRNVLRIIHFAQQTLKQAGFTHPKIVVAGLNPHAGEGGMIGTEEIDDILPAVKQAKREGIDAEGPYPADTIFLRRNKEPFDCMVSMYHDQGQTGMKLLGFDKGVTVSGGLPVVLTTPAHGTAFDIAGTGTADAGAMENAMELAVQMAKNKNRGN